MNGVPLVSKRIVLFVLAVMTAVALFMVSSVVMASSASAVPPDREDRAEAKEKRFEDRAEAKEKRSEDKQERFD